MIFRKDRYLIQRKGISYEIDLTEGIDLSLFLFGGFQSYLLSTVQSQGIPENAVVIDVGANCGSMSLPLAQLFPRGQVVAIEPTNYAFAKLQRNLELNPSLSPRILPLKLFLSDQKTKAPPLEVYASWKVDQRYSNAHPLHRGVPQEIGSAQTLTLDELMQTQNIPSVHLIKIDTDGHEYQILQGATPVLRTHRPVVVFEVGMYVMEERGIRFEDYLGFFEDLGYRLINSKNGKRVNRETYLQEIPLRSTTDVIAIPHP